jgi:hypothetical protein
MVTYRRGRKPGPAGLGHRKARTIRFPVSLSEELKDAARAAGDPKPTRYVVGLIADALDAGVTIEETIVMREMAGRPGQPSKGPRVPWTLRFPDAADVRLQKAVRDAGYTEVNDFVVDFAAAALGAGTGPRTIQQPLLQMTA